MFEKLSNSFALARYSWGVLRTDKQLLIFPILSGISCMLVSLSFAAPVLLLAMRRDRQVAILWATHLCDEVPDADRVIVLHRGKVLADTTPRKLIETSGKASVEEAFLAVLAGAR